MDVGVRTHTLMPGDGAVCHGATWCQVEEVLLCVLGSGIGLLYI